MLKYNFFTLFWALVLLFSACSEPAPSWSEAEKENIRHFLVSAESSRAATAYLNDADIPFVQEEYLKIVKLALSEAKKVDDAVLAKAHPDLPERFRNLYQESLEKTVKAFETKDNEESVVASSLHDQWVAWFNQNRSRIRIPN